MLISLHLIVSHRELHHDENLVVFANNTKL